MQVSLDIDIEGLIKSNAMAQVLLRAAIVKGARDLGRFSLERIKDETPIDTGNVRNSWQLDLDFHSGLTGTSFTVASNGDEKTQNIIRWHEWGTGIYGPLGKMIKPKTAPWLHWIDRETGEHRFAKEVRGVPPQLMVTSTKTLLQAKTEDLAREMEAQISKAFER